MKRIILLTDEESNFLVSKADFRNFTSMDIEKIKTYFLAKNYNVDVYKFSELDLRQDYNGVYILYQTSEAPGSFYKRYIEDVVYFLERQGAVMLPKYEQLKAHHNKLYMEFLRSHFNDKSLRTIKSKCYGSWVDALSYDSDFPVVIKQISSSGGAGVFLARNRLEYCKLIRKAGKIIVVQNLKGLVVNFFKDVVKKLIKYFFPSKSKYVQFKTEPLSTAMVVQQFIEGLNGDYKVLIYGRKYYTLYRKNRVNDFRASGSGRFYEVPEEEHEGLLNYARKITSEIDFPIFGLDIGFDGKDYHLLEYQMIHLGPFSLQISKFWHEFEDGKLIRHVGESDLEEEFSRSIIDYISVH
jgi:glutathione synthase/RimK-type ligase-like ATP-grasp enzyme